MSILLKNTYLMPNFNSDFLTYPQYYEKFKKTGSPLGSSLLLGKTGNPVTSQLGAAGLSTLTNYIGQLGGNIFDNDSLVGQYFNQGFGTVLNTSSDTIANNILLGESFAKGLGSNIGLSLTNVGVGIGADLVGRGITSLGGNSKFSKGLGAGTSTAIKAAPSIVKNLKTVGNISKANLWGAGMSIAGSALEAAFGPSKEYNGRYGNITRTMDSIYDVAQGVVGTLGPAGMAISGAMALNKGLSNIFGSTDAMTNQDAIFGSAFMPAPVKWLNMAGAKTTQNFNNQSTKNINNVNNFMMDGYKNYGKRFDTAREEANKTYGTSSRKEYKKANKNLSWANTTFANLMGMANLNYYLNIRGEDMSSTNNQLYAQLIQGGWKPIVAGKQGMKLLSNAINPNMGMRLLSAASLIDNKQIILSNYNEI